MANKRMFSKELVCDRRFNDLKSSTKYLFFMLCLYADDEGVVADPKGVVRFHKCSMKDLNKLYETHYLLQFPSGVAIVKHWFAHNYNQKSHIKKSTYQEELQSLFIDERGFYSTKNKDFCRKNAVKMPSNTAVKMPNSIDKYSIDKNSIDNNIYTSTKNFTPPTLEEVKAYCLERNNNIDAEQFIDFYESKGWMVGKNKMKNWKASIRTWEKANKNKMIKQETTQQKNDRNLKAMKEEMDRMLEEYQNDITGNNNLNGANQNLITDNSNTRYSK